MTFSQLFPRTLEFETHMSACDTRIEAMTTSKDEVLTKALFGN